MDELKQGIDEIEKNNFNDAKEIFSDTMIGASNILAYNKEDREAQQILTFGSAALKSADCMEKLMSGAVGMAACSSYIGLACCATSLLLMTMEEDTNPIGEMLQEIGESIQALREDLYQMKKTLLKKMYEIFNHTLEEFDKVKELIGESHKYILMNLNQLSDNINIFKNNVNIQLTNISDNLNKLHQINKKLDILLINKYIKVCSNIADYENRYESLEFLKYKDFVKYTTTIEDLLCGASLPLKYLNGLSVIENNCVNDELLYLCSEVEPESKLGYLGYKIFNENLDLDRYMKNDLFKDVKNIVDTVKEFESKNKEFVFCNLSNVNLFIHGILLYLKLRRTFINKPYDSKCILINRLFQKGRETIEYLKYLFENRIDIFFKIGLDHIVNSFNVMHFYIQKKSDHFKRIADNINETRNMIMKSMVERQIEYIKLIEGKDKEGFKVYKFYKYWNEANDDYLRKHYLKRLENQIKLVSECTFHHPFSHSNLPIIPFAISNEKNGLKNFSMIIDLSIDSAYYTFSNNEKFESYNLLNQIYHFRNSYKEFLRLIPETYYIAERLGVGYIKLSHGNYKTTKFHPTKGFHCGEVEYDIIFDFSVSTDKGFINYPIGSFTCKSSVYNLINNREYVTQPNIWEIWDKSPIVQDFYLSIALYTCKLSYIDEDNIKYLTSLIDFTPLNKIKKDEQDKVVVDFENHKLTLKDVYIISCLAPKFTIDNFKLCESEPLLRCQVEFEKNKKLSREYIFLTQNMIDGDLKFELDNLLNKYELSRLFILSFVKLTNLHHQELLNELISKEQYIGLLCNFIDLHAKFIKQSINFNYISINDKQITLEQANIKFKEFTNGVGAKYLNIFNKSIVFPKLTDEFIAIIFKVIDKYRDEPLILKKLVSCVDQIAYFINDFKNVHNL
jgi:hypothetical protein